MPTKEQIFVFVYGTLKRGFGNHRLLKDSVFIGEDVLPEADMFSLGGYPAIALRGTKDENAEHKVYGEVFTVDEDTLKRLDGLEGHPDYYQRVDAVTEFGRRVQVYTMSMGYLTRRQNAPPVPNGVWERTKYDL